MCVLKEKKKTSCLIGDWTERTDEIIRYQSFNFDRSVTISVFAVRLDWIAINGPDGGSARRRFFSHIFYTVSPLIYRFADWTCEKSTPCRFISNVYVFFSGTTHPIKHTALRVVFMVFYFFPKCNFSSLKHDGTLNYGSGMVLSTAILYG